MTYEDFIQQYMDQQTGYGGGPINTQMPDGGGYNIRPPVTDPTAPPPPPKTVPAPPAASSYYATPADSQAAKGYSGFNGGVEEAFLSMVANGGFGKGASGRGAGFVAGGNAYRNNLQALADEFNHRYGAQARAVGDDKIDFGDGRGPVDVITTQGDFWYGGAGSGGAGGGGGDAGAGGGGGMGAAGAGYGPGGASGFDASGAGFGATPPPFSYADFVAPSLTNTTDPGYLERLGLGRKAIEHRQAAEGTYLTGGALTELTRYGQDYGSNEYNNVYGRGKTTYDTNRGNALDNYLTNYGIKRGAEGDYWNRLKDVSGSGLSAALGSRYA